MTHVTSRLRSLLVPWLVALAALALLAGLATPVQAAGAWIATGPMVNSHAWHAMTGLPDGRVLVAGGSDGFPGLAAAEIYDPATNTWAVTGSMSVTRASHTLTLLDDGRVLVAGGVDNPNYSNVTYSSAEIYDPATGMWSTTGSMTVARSHHTATRLNDGRVLVVSGATAELYNPASGTWSATGTLGTSRGGHTATVLPDGRVLVVGGLFGGLVPLTSAELYDPATGTWSPTGNLGVGRWDHAAALLSDGQVLIFGGKAVSGDSGGNLIMLSSAERYNPATGTWITTGNLGTARALHSATALTDGRILAAGGLTTGSILSSAELFDPVGGAWSAAGSMSDSRARHTAAGLADGRVLVVGGGGDGSGTCCAEVFSLSGTPPPPTPVPAAITVAAPNGGEVWRIGTARSIQWSATGVTGNVTIQVSRDGGTSFTMIASSVPNSGSFQWAVTAPASTQALIRVSSVNQPAVQDTSDGTFRIRR